MIILTLLIREPDNTSAAAKAITPLICPYTATLGSAATIVSSRRYRELRNGEETHGLTAVELELLDAGRMDFPTLAAKLEKFLKARAKDAGFVAGFELLRMETPAAPAASVN